MNFRGEYKTVNELVFFLDQHISGSFSTSDMEVLKTECEKLKAGEVYFEVGVAEGKSLSTAYNFSKPGVLCVGVDYYDPIARTPFMNKWLSDSDCIYAQANSRTLRKVWNKEIALLFIDGAHDDKSVEDDYNDWSPFVKKGGVILFHDYDGQNAMGVPHFVDKHFPNAEILHGKIAKVICE